MADYKYKGATPVDEPVAKPKAPAASAPKGKDYSYPDSTPVDEPVAKPAKKYAKGGSIDGIAQRGKTKGTQVKMACGGKVKK